MDKDEFKKDFLDMFMKYVFVEHSKGIAFNLSVFTDKLLEKYEIKKKE